MKNIVYICNANNSYRESSRIQTRFRAYSCFTSDSFGCGLLAQLGGTPLFFTY